MFKSILILLGLTAATYAAKWDGLRVTWGLNPFSQWDFAKLPRDMSNDDMQGFVPMDDLCATKGPFAGRRYWVPSDPSLILLFDKNGYIAGMQTMIPVGSYTPSTPMQGHPMINYNGYWHLTAYYVDPSTICTTGRTADQFGSQGTGNGLWIQNGTDYTTGNLLQIPMTQAGMGSTSWTLGHCFYTMGVHYWYNVTKDMSCDNFFPFFILYNDQKLNSWGFATNYAGGGSNRYEHPPHSAIGGFMNPVPDCFTSDPSFNALSTMHVYMTDSPRTGNLC